MRPDFGHVEDVDGEGGDGGGGESLDVDVVGGEIASGDGVEEVERPGVRVGAGKGVALG